MSVMPELINSFAQIAEGLAALSHYPYAERKDAWLERLDVNLPELQRLSQLPETGYPAYQAKAGKMLGAGSEDLRHASGIAALARHARAHADTVADLALQALERARSHSNLNAFIELATENELTQQGREVTTALRTDSSLPLFGIPIAVKDLMAVKGRNLTGGSKRQDQEPSTHDAIAVERLRAAGALMLGTTNLHELAYGITSQNPHHGGVVNPHGGAYISGGSSGGSAAAVAAGIVRASIGTDTAGSIRIPAACCGVVGFKPSYDAIPRSGALDLGPSLDHLGPITQSVDDAALMFSIMAGMKPQVAAPLDSLAGIRVGVPSSYFFDPLAPDVAHAIDIALQKMRIDGAELVPIDLPGMEICAALQFITLCSEATDIHWRRLLDRPQDLGEDVRVRLEIGQLFPALWYTRAQRVRASLAATLDAAMAQVDVLATPTLRVTAPPVGAGSVQINNRTMALHSAITSLTLPFNLTGMPALSLPCGIGENDLPVGLQLIGARHDDWKLLSISNRVEALLENTHSRERRH